MEKAMKSLLGGMRPRETRELVADHVQKVAIDPRKQEVTLWVDKRYAFNAIISSEHIGRLIRGVKMAFGDEYETVILVAGPHTPSEREKALPRSIRYG